MRVVAVYNMKGGVGKTTAAVNLSYLTASAGQRVLLWDLDPQAAASFAFRIRPRIAGFGRKSLESGRAFADAIKETDYANLHLLPADFACRKLDRFLDDLNKPKRVLRSLIETIGSDYDLVLLDCPAGFSLVTEGIFAAASAVLVPTVPTVLSLRTLIKLMKWAERSESTAVLGAFFSMVDRRKTLHRHACEWSRDYPDVFLSGLIPYSSVVEQMAARRMPLGAFAPRDTATTAFSDVWTEFERRLLHHRPDVSAHERWEAHRRDVEALMARLDMPDQAESPAVHRASVIDMRDRDSTNGPAPAISASPADMHVIHRFDTDDDALRRRGIALELHERRGTWLLVLTASARGAEMSRRAHAQVDRSWAFEILSGAMSPLAALEQRAGRLEPSLFDNSRDLIADKVLQRLDSRIADAPTAARREPPATDERVPSTIRQAM